MVSDFLSLSERADIQALKSITTDSGRGFVVNSFFISNLQTSMSWVGRAWLRKCLNDKTLAQWISKLTSQRDRLLYVSDVGLANYTLALTIHL
jgi:hypothetical protein